MKKYGKDIYQKFNKKSTEELLEIFNRSNLDEYTQETLCVIEDILKNRRCGKKKKRYYTKNQSITKKNKKNRNSDRYIEYYGEKKKGIDNILKMIPNSPLGCVVYLMEVLLLFIVHFYVEVNIVLRMLLVPSIIFFNIILKEIVGEENF